MLYRGESKARHERNGGEVRPKGTASTFVPRCDGSWVFDGRFKYGATESNATYAHQIEPQDMPKNQGKSRSEQVGFPPTCNISTSTCHDIARKFATHDNIQEGVIYHIDDSLFERYGVEIMAVDNPPHPENKEVTIRAHDYGALPPEVIVKVEPVFPV